MSTFLRNSFEYGVNTEQCYEAGISAAVATTRFQAAVNDAVARKLPLVIRGRGRVLEITSTITFAGALDIDGGSPGETIIRGDLANILSHSNPGTPASHLNIRGVKFTCSTATADRYAINLANSWISRVTLDECEFYNCGVLLRLGQGNSVGLLNKTSVTRCSWNSDDVAIGYQPFTFRNGDYQNIGSGTPPAEPREDRNIGFTFSNNVMDLYCTDGFNQNIATFGYGLTQGETITANTFRNRNLLSAAEVDLAYGGDHAIYANNQHYNTGMVCKGSIGSLGSRGYVEPAVNEDQIISDNRFKFAAASKNPYAMLILGAFKSITGNIIRAQKDNNTAGAFIAVSINQSSLDYAPLGVRAGYYCLIANNIIDVRLASKTGSYEISPLQQTGIAGMRRSIILGNLIMGGTHSGLNSDALAPGVVAANFWTETDHYPEGDIAIMNRGAAANVAVKANGSASPNIFSELNIESNQGEVEWYDCGTYPAFSASHGSYYQWDTSSSAVSVTNSTANIGEISDVVVLRRKPGTTYSLTLKHGTNFRMAGATDQVIDSDFKFIRMRKMTASVWVQDGGYMG